MLDYTIDILLIGFITVLMIQLVKAPIKAILKKKGLKDSVKASNLFKIIVTTLSYAMCFVGACIYFRYFLCVPIFTDFKIVGYTIGAVGASQSIYGVLEAYGRDGLLAIFKALKEKAKARKITDLAALPIIGTDVLAGKIAEGIYRRFEGAPITREDIKQILEEIK